MFVCVRGCVCCIHKSVVCVVCTLLYVLQACMSVCVVYDLCRKGSSASVCAYVCVAFCGRACACVCVCECVCAVCTWLHNVSGRVYDHDACTLCELGIILHICRVGQNHIQCVYGILGREITIYMVIYV